jgi:hypothetical protein
MIHVNSQTLWSLLPSPSHRHLPSLSGPNNYLQLRVACISEDKVRMAKLQSK